MARQPAKKCVIFKLFAPEATEVFLIGSFDDWDMVRRPMKQDEKGTWKTRVNLAPGEYEYRFFVDGEWQDDPVCEERVASAVGALNCVVRV